MVKVKDIEVVLLDMFEYIKDNIQTSISSLNSEKEDTAIKDLVLDDENLLEDITPEPIGGINNYIEDPDFDNDPLDGLTYYGDTNTQWKTTSPPQASYNSNRKAIALNSQYSYNTRIYTTIFELDNSYDISITIDEFEILEGTVSNGKIAVYFEEVLIDTITAVGTYTYTYTGVGGNGRLTLAGGLLSYPNSTIGYIGNVTVTDTPGSTETYIDISNTFIIQSPNDKQGEVIFNNVNCKKLDKIQYSVLNSVNVSMALVYIKKNDIIEYFTALQTTPGEYILEVGPFYGEYDISIILVSNTEGDKFYELGYFKATEPMSKNIFLWNSNEIPNYPVSYVLDLADDSINVKSNDGYNFIATYRVRLTSFVYFNAETIHEHIGETYTILINRYSRLFFNFFRDFLANKYKLTFREISTGFGEDKLGKEVVTAALTFTIDIVL